MPKLRVLSGKEVVKILSKFGFEVVSQRILPDGTKQTLTVPLHDELDKGTLKAIIRRASRYIPEEELKPYFYR